MRCASPPAWVYPRSFLAAQPVRVFNPWQVWRLSRPGTPEPSRSWSAMLSLLAPSSALLLPARSRPLRMSVDPAALIQPAAFFSAGLLVGGLSSRINPGGGRPLECIWVRPGTSRIGGVGLVCVQVAETVSRKPCSVRVVQRVVPSLRYRCTSVVLPLRAGYASRCVHLHVRPAQLQDRAAQELRPAAARRAGCDPRDVRRCR